MHKTQPLHTSLFYENQTGCQLQVYQGTDKRNVVLLSTAHEEAKIPAFYLKCGKSVPNDKRKPNTVLFYNKNKVKNR